MFLAVLNYVVYFSGCVTLAFLAGFLSQPEICQRIAFKTTFVLVTASSGITAARKRMYGYLFETTPISMKGQRKQLRRMNITI
jgi:hypothetical protein